MAGPMPVPNSEVPEGAAVFPLSFGIIRDEFHERMTMALAVIASLTAVGFGVGIVVAGPIVTAFGSVRWR